MPIAVGLRWIEIDDDAGALAFEFGEPGVVLLALRREGGADTTTGYWLDEQGKVLGRVEAGQA
ncbi:MAG: hypothetical protein ACOC1F_04020 [Myxococcota bacterium]